MPFITIPKRYSPHQYTIEDMMNGVTEQDILRWAYDSKDTITVFRKETPVNLLLKYSVPLALRTLRAFNASHANLIEVDDKSSLYRSFKIPKKSGGYRQIDAPNDELMNALIELKNILETNFMANYHTCAFAYIKGRSTVDAVKRHQMNNSRWFLKLDFHNFFGSTTEEFLLRQLRMIFPFNVVLEDDEGEVELKKALSLCFLKGGLPQGTPISPLLTNIMMIPIDHDIAKMCRENVPHLCYTRYADDILLSSDLQFEGSAIRRIMNLSEIKDKVESLRGTSSLSLYKVTKGRSLVAYSLTESAVSDYKAEEGFACELITVSASDKAQFAAMLERMIERAHWNTNAIAKVLNILQTYEAPFKLSFHKTRYGSSAGRNWNLGLMLNKDNQITVGHSRKKQLKVAIFSFISDYKAGRMWNLDDIQTLQGHISYVKMVEPDAMQAIINTYNQKFSVNLFDIIKEELTQEV